MNIRPENETDHTAVERINDLAFGGPAEGRLVAGLRELAGTISLVAEVDGALLGHIMFSQGEVHDAETDAHHTVMILAPMAVLPEWQGQGIGNRLVEQGLSACRSAGHRLVVVLGHPWYYPRFGFTPASRFGIHYPQPVRDEVFMAQELVPGAAHEVQGILQLPEPFRHVS